MKWDVSTLDAVKAGDIDLDEVVFGGPVRPDIIHRMIRWQMAKARAGTHKTKGISEISGTTAKPYKQKGTGRARQGSLRSPQFRGGATIFGPVVRDHGFDLPKKVRKFALRSALSSKRADGKLIVLEDAKLDAPKTKTLVDKLAKLGLGSALFIDGPEVDRNFHRAVANIPGIDVLPQQGANVRDVLKHDTLVLTRDAVKHLEARLK